MINMKKKDYNNYFNDIEISKSESEQIKNNILNNKIKSHKLRPTFILLLIVIISISVITPTAAIIRNNPITVFKKGENHNKNEGDHEGDINVYSNTISKKIYPPNLLKINTTYKTEEVEKLLNIHIPKNKMTMMQFLNVHALETDNEKITKLTLINYDALNGTFFGTDKHYLSEPRYNITICTIECAKEEIHQIMAITAADLKTTKYYIKSIDTEATIVYQDREEEVAYDGSGYIYTPIDWFIIFDYEDVNYVIMVNGYDFKRKDYIYEVLESFYI